MNFVNDERRPEPNRRRMSACMDAAHDDQLRAIERLTVVERIMLALHLHERDMVIQELTRKR